MSENGHTILEHALALCETMQSHADAREWELVTQLERRRRELIDQALADKPTGLSEALKKILEADARIKAVAEAAREELVEELARARAAHKAAKAYESAER